MLKSWFIRNFYALIITQAWGLIFGPLIFIFTILGAEKLGPEITSVFAIFAIIITIPSLINYYEFQKEEYYFSKDQSRRFSNKDRIKYTEADKL